MIGLIERAMNKIKEVNLDFEIYTCSIWTDPSSAASSISFDSYINSKKKIEKANKWSKKHYDRLIKEKDFEQAELFKPIEGRNTSPADFELRDFVVIENKSFDLNWEGDSEGKCWDKLESVLIEVGEYAYNKIQELKLSDDFELSVNGRNDWYEYAWNKNEK